MRITIGIVLAVAWIVALAVSPHDSTLIAILAAASLGLIVGWSISSVSWYKLTGNPDEDSMRVFHARHDWTEPMWLAILLGGVFLACFSTIGVLRLGPSGTAICAMVYLALVVSIGHPRCIKPRPGRRHDDNYHQAQMFGDTEDIYDNSQEGYP